MAFVRLRQVAATRHVTLVLTGLSADVGQKLGALATARSVQRLPTLQDGIDWMEADALAALPPRSPSPEFAERLTALLGEAISAWGAGRYHRPGH